LGNDFLVFGFGFCQLKTGVKMYYNIIINNEIFEVIEWWKGDTERIEVVHSPGWFLGTCDQEFCKMKTTGIRYYVNFKVPKGFNLESIETRLNIILLVSKYGEHQHEPYSGMIKLCEVGGSLEGRDCTIWYQLEAPKVSYMEM
jgi:hypothetical protein